MVMLDDPRAEILAQLAAVNASAKRIPAHWVDSKAAIHAKIDALLDDLDSLGG